MPEFLKQFGEEVYRPSEPQMPGSGGTSVWHFKVVAPGSGTLRFAYKRPWETDVTEKIAEFAVTIQE